MYLEFFFNYVMVNTYENKESISENWIKENLMVNLLTMNPSSLKNYCIHSECGIIDTCIWLWKQETAPFHSCNA